MGINLIKINDAVDIFSGNGGNNEEESATDLLTDLRKFCQWNEIDFDKMLAMSEIHFNSEAKPFSIAPDEIDSGTSDNTDDQSAVCDNCGKQFKVGELHGYHDFWSRVEIGKEIPAGDCPDCGAFAYLVKPKIKLKVAFGETRALQRETEKVMEFDTEAEKSAYTEGLGDMDGWLNYEIFDN